MAHRDPHEQPVLTSTATTDASDELANLRRDVFGPHILMSRIEEKNLETLKKIRAFRKAAGGKPKFRDLGSEAQNSAYFGIVPCRATGCDVVMFHSNDDVVVKRYLWLGEDGYEPRIVRQWVRWCRHTPGVILDIGAYTGLMSLLAARANGQNKVHLFEPIEATIERANINVKLNGFGQRILRHNLAASDREGESRINMFREKDFLATGNSLFAKKGKAILGTKSITAVAIDNYLPGVQPTVVKIDVEGHELACLQGMIKTLKRARPFIVIEVWEHTREKVLTFLRDLNYDLQRVEAVDARVNNFFAVPKS